MTVTSVSVGQAAAAMAAAMAMRWSPRASTRPGWSGPPAPDTTRSSPSTAPRAPNASTSSAVPARRSDSFTRSSPTSRKVVRPSARAAATARMGTSSSDGISADSTTVPTNREVRLVTDPIPSPVSSTSIAAPIRRSTSRNPMRSAPRGTPDTVPRLPGTIAPGSRVTVSGIHLGAERMGFLDVLRRMGAAIEVEETGEGIGSVTSRTSRLVGTVVESAEIPSLDEVPILAVAAARAEGPTTFRDVGELRVKESDRLAGTAELVEAFGARAAVEGDDLVVTGAGGPLHPGRVDARGDHRMAMAAAIAAAACPTDTDVTVITGWESVATSYPGFTADLHRIGSNGEGG